MAKELKRLHAIVNGRVQGVSFRYYTTLKANQLEIVGWVHNRKDGRVEVLAEGTQAALDELERWLHEGSPDAKVEEIYVTWEEAMGDFTEFKTIYFRDLDT